MVAATPLASQPEPTSVLRGRDMLCFGHDWTGDPLSKTHLMRLLARDNRVLWINSIGYRAPAASARDIRRIFEKLRAAATPVAEVERNIFVLNPLAIPAYHVDALQRVNRELLRYQVWRAMDRLGFSRVVNWVFNPTASVVAGSLSEDLVVYYCVDEFTAFSGVPARLVELERRLLRGADLVIVSSEALYRSKSRAQPAHDARPPRRRLRALPQGARARDAGAGGGEGPPAARHRLLRADGEGLDRRRSHGPRRPALLRPDRWSSSAR